MVRTPIRQKTEEKEKTREKKQPFFDERSTAKYESEREKEESEKYKLPEIRGKPKVEYNGR